MKSKSMNALPQQVLDQMLQVGVNIQTARLRRRWTQEETAVRAQVGLSALKKIESGNLNVELSSLVAMLWALGLEASLMHIADPARDLEGIHLEKTRQRLSRRARAVSHELDNDF